MTKKTKRRDVDAGSATDRPEVTDTTNTQSGHTESGQEAVRGNAAALHDTEHQSNYGGGGAKAARDHA